MLQVKTDYTEYIVKVTVTSEDKAIDLTSPEFRIDIGDYLYSYLHRGEIRSGIDEVITEASEPLAVVTKDNVATYCNTDEESLIRNGFQFWVSEDHKTMEMRFVPKNTVEDKPDHHWYVLLVVIAFDFENTARFDLCLMPRLMPGEIKKKYPNADDDKILPASAVRPDYIFSDANDKDHLFINNYLDRSEPGSQLYAATFSAYMPDDLAVDLGIDVVNPGNWTRKIAFCQPGTNEGLALDGLDIDTARDQNIMGCSGINVVTITQDINPVDKVDYYKDHVMVEYEF